MITVRTATFQAAQQGGSAPIEDATPWEEVLAQGADWNKVLQVAAEGNRDRFDPQTAGTAV